MITVKINVFATPYTLDVPEGTTVADVFRILDVDAAAKIAEGWQLQGWVGDSELGPISLYEVLKPRTIIIFLPRMIAGAELGRFEELERRMVDRIEVLSRSASQLRLDVEYVWGSVRRRKAEPLTFTAFWRGFTKQFGGNWWRYFSIPTLVLLLVFLCLSWLLLSVEKGHQSGIDNFGQSALAVISFMLTLGHAQPLGLAGQIIGIISCAMGIVVFGLFVSLLFYSLQD